MTSIATIYFNVVPLLVAFTVMAIGALVYTGDKTNKVDKAWLWSCIFASLWSLFFFLVINSSSESESLTLRVYMDTSAILVMFFWFRFVIVFLEIKSLYWIRFSFMLTTILLILNISPGFVRGMTPKFVFNYYVDAGWGYYLFSVYFVLLALCGLTLLLVHNQKSRGIRSVQIKNVFVGSLVGMIGGGSSFLLSFNIPVPPYLFILFACLPLIIARGIIKYKLFNVRAVAIELFVLAIWIFLTIRLVLSATQQDIVINLISLVAVVVFGILIIRSMYNEIRQRERIEVLATDLQKANDRLTELDRQKSEFVSFATHQLRAPLTAMKGYGSLLLEGDLGPLSAEAKQGIQRIFDSTNTLVNIVNDYLNITRIELGTMKYAFDSVDFRELVSDVVAELGPNIDKAAAKFSFRVEAPENSTLDWRITADRDKLKQVIENLIDNSIKYTPSGTIAARLSYDRARHKYIFAVKDTGVGIAPEVVPRLFQKFSRAENANKVNIRGTGLGLYVAKQMVEAHHGTIRVESPGEGKGSTFIVELDPLAKA
ncbi:MAG: hypothetical protein KGI59_01540 [Patescibacteria group bacterium]|nr:hypothetical protein [Patescibacteria group bacterium]